MAEQARGKRLGPGVNALLISLAALEAVVLWRFASFTADDAYIVYRYAEQLVASNGLVFNPGERINALTSPLHAMVCAVLHATFEDTVLANKLLSVMVVVLALAAGLSHLQSRPTHAVIFAVAVGLSPFLSLWTVGGLETPILLAGITLLTVILRRRGGYLRPRGAFGVSLLMGACFLTRYDAAIYLLPCALFLLWRQPRYAPLLVLPGLLVVVAWFGFAEAYFGDILPTSFYLKKPSLGGRSVKMNATYLAQFVLLSGAVFLIPGALRAWRRADGPRHLWWWAAALFGVFLYSLSAATTHMMFAYRLLVPYLPSLVLLLLDAGPAGRNISNNGASRIVVAAAPFLLLNLALIVVTEFYSINPGWVSEYRHVPRREYAGPRSEVMDLAAGELRQHWSSQPASGQREPVIHTFAEGRLPYLFRELHVLGKLVSYRKDCRLSAWKLRQYADYLHVLAPRHGRLAHQLPKPLSSYELVSRHDIIYDGRQETFRVYYQADPPPQPLPAKIAGPCENPTRVDDP